MSPHWVRCSPRAIASQMTANNSKSFCLLDRSGCRRKDPINDREETANLPLHRLVTAIRTDRAAAEVRLQHRQDLRSVPVLADREAWPDLPADQQGRARRQ